MPPAASISMPAAEASGWFDTAMPSRPCADSFSQVKSVPARSRQLDVLMRSPHPEEARSAVSKGGNEHHVCCPSFETPRGARLLRMRLRAEHASVEGAAGVDDDGLAG